MTHARTTFLLAVVVWLGSGCGRTGPPAVAESSRVAEQVWCADRHGHLDVRRRVSDPSSTAGGIVGWMAHRRSAGPTMRRRLDIVLGGGRVR